MFWFAIPVGPLILAFLISSALEAAIRRGLLLGHGDPLFFVKSPLSIVLASVIVISMALLLRSKWKSRMSR
jgi:TctA family transporter